jgi:predicted nucleic acid-binding protein
LTNVIIDSSAWIEYMFGTKKGAEVRKVIENPKNEIYTPNVVRSEVLSKFVRNGYPPEKIIETIETISLTPKETPEIYFEAGKIHAALKEKTGIGMIDSIILSIAKYNNAKILSFDKHLIQKNTLNYT